MNVNVQQTKARLIANTRRKTRLDDLYTIAISISQLKNHFGSLKKVTQEIVDITPNMLTRFLSVLKVDQRIIPLIQNRQIDNINALYYIQKLQPNDQVYLAKLLVEGKIDSRDIRAIAPIKKRFPNKDIGETVKFVLDSKDKKRYIVKFDVSKQTKRKEIETLLKEILSLQDFEVTERNKIGTITLSKYGYSQIRKYCVIHHTTFKKYIQSIISPK